MSEVGLGLTIGIAALILLGQNYRRHCEGKIWLSRVLAIGARYF
jgi:hypothetical protein